MRWNLLLKLSFKRLSSCVKCLSPGGRPGGAVLVLWSQVFLHQRRAPPCQTSSDSQSPLKSHPGDLYEKVITVESEGVQHPLAPTVWSSEYKKPRSLGFPWTDCHPTGTPGAAGSFTDAAGALPPEGF